MHPARPIVPALVLSALCIAPAWSATAAGVGDFYRGKTITLIVGSGPGGFYDVGARTIARRLGQFIPGRPTVIVQNMPGASSVLAADYLFNVARRDGTVIGDIQPTIVLNKALDPSAKYRPQDYAWIGRLRRNTVYGMVWHSAPAVTIEQARREPLIFAANAASGYAAMLPWALNRMAGTKIKVVTGYLSETAEWLAIERNEANGIGSASPIDVPGAEWLSKGLVKIMYSNATQRTALAPQAPTLIEAAGNEGDRLAMRLLSGSSEIGESILAPPSTPSDRVAALRDAFAKMVHDQGFIADAQRSRVDLEFLPGDRVQKVVSDASGTPAGVIDRVKELTRPPD